MDRGPWPLDPATDAPRAFAEYQDAKPDLSARLGPYCSYCEMPIKNLPAVEHIQPKGGLAGKPDLERAWCNLLLACGHCNPIKHDKAAALGDCFWPDQDNTFRALAYDMPGRVEVHRDLHAEHTARARRTIELTGLDRAPDHPSHSDKDKRWMHRKEALTMALRSKDRLSAHDTEQMRDQIVETAVATGFWSVWMTVFSEDADMRRRLIVAFPGTSCACFDEQARQGPRRCGAL